MQLWPHSRVNKDVCWSVHMYYWVSLPPPSTFSLSFHSWLLWGSFSIKNETDRDRTKVNSDFLDNFCAKRCFNAAYHKVRVYLEYHSVCFLVGIGTPHPFSRKRVCKPHTLNQRGGHTRLRVRGRPNSDDWRKSLALCLLYAAYTVYFSSKLRSNFSIWLAYWRIVFSKY